MKKIKITFQRITPESAEDGEFSETGWENEEGIEMSSVKEAIKFLKFAGASEPSCSQFCKDVGYTTVDPEINYSTGEQTFYSFHLTGFSEKEQQEIFDEITNK